MEENIPVMNLITSVNMKVSKGSLQTAYTPQQNRVAERMNRTLLERTRAMLKATGLGKSFWAEQSIQPVM